jgi:hypothetical protein
VHETLSQKKTYHKKGLWSGSKCRPWVQAPVPHAQKNREGRVAQVTEHLPSKQYHQNKWIKKKKSLKKHFSKKEKHIK